MDTTLATHWIQSAPCTLHGAFVIVALLLVIFRLPALRTYGSRAALEKFFKRIEAV